MGKKRSAVDVKMGRGARSEGWLDVNGRKVRMLFTNRVLAKAEVALGKSILEIADEARMGKTSMGDTARLLLVGMQASHNEDAGNGDFPDALMPSLELAYDVIDAAGFSEVARVVIECIAAVLGYKPKPEAELLPAD